MVSTHTHHGLPSAEGAKDGLEVALFTLWLRTRKKLTATNHSPLGLQGHQRANGQRATSAARDRQARNILGNNKMLNAQVGAKKEEKMAGVEGKNVCAAKLVAA